MWTTLDTTLGKEKPEGVKKAIVAFKTLDLKKWAEKAGAMKVLLDTVFQKVMIPAWEQCAVWGQQASSLCQWEARPGGSRPDDEPSARRAPRGSLDWGARQPGTAGSGGRPLAFHHNQNSR
jgi:hypothetical protein